MQDLARSRLIFALDVPEPADADDWVGRLAPWFGMFKVGVELVTAGGPDVVRRVVERADADVFLDLKLHDIPTTVERAARAASRLGIRMLTVHVGGGRPMLEAAVRGAGGGVCILGVTQLTSSAASAEGVVELARVACESGCGGVVCAGTEARAVRDAVGPEVRIVCPGVRPAGTEHGDQVRIVTPGEALRAGASHLVVGRPVRDAPDPESAARGILEEATKALAPAEGSEPTG
jgi:orotidine-5'-phosphate decarboxylase